MEDLGFWLAAMAASILVGMGKGGLPMTATLAVPVFSLAVSPIMAAGILLPVYVVSDMFGLYAYRRDFNPRVLLIITSGMTLGVIFGWATATIIAERAVTGLVGLIGLCFALHTMMRQTNIAPPRHPRLASGLFWGAVSGFTSFVSHAGAAPYQVYTLPLGLRKSVYAGTTTIAFSYVNAIKLIPYAALGQLSLYTIKIAALMMPFAAIAVFAGVRLVKTIPEVLFFRLVTWALLLISIKLLFDAIAG